MKTKMIKSFSLVLTLIMLLSAIPFTASAADPITLTRDNITQWPTVTNKDGSEPKIQLYAGQRFDEAWALKGGEVRYDANENGELEESEVVPGTFVFYDERALNGADYIQISFIPDDETAYTRIENVRDGNVMGSVGGVTYVVPEIVELPTATEVESGARLSKSTISGGKVIHPISGEEITYGTWAWTSTRTKITDSGYQEAKFIISRDFETLTAKIYVRIVGDTSEEKIGTIIEELPAIEGTYYIGENWENVKLVGGKAVDDINGFEVPGTFTINRTGTIATSGTYEVEVIFTPDDNTKYSVSTGKIEITVIKQPIRFIDEDGNDTIPEITIEYTNAKIGQYNFGYYLKPYTNLTDSDGASFNFAGLEGENDYITVGTKKYKINASAQNQNYEKSVLEFILTVTPKPLDITVSYVNNQILISRTTTDRINGSFELYVDGVKLADGVKIEGAQSSAKYGWTPKTSGTHTVKAVYVPAENDTVSIEPAETQVQMNLTRALTLPEGSGYIAKVNGSSNFTSVACGDTVSLACTFEDFECWVITGADGKAVDLGTVMTEKTVTDANGGVTFVTEEGDLTCANIIFAMPDEDITVTYKLKEADTGNDPVDGEKDFFAQVKAFFAGLFDGQTNCPVLKWIINAFNVIVNFFTGLFVK